MSEKKPWEYEEIIVEQGVGRDFEGDFWLYVGEDKQVGVVTQEAPGGADAWANLFKASPKLVQALLLNGAAIVPGGSWHTHNCWMRPDIRASCSEACKATRLALGLAGVPLP